MSLPGKGNRLLTDSFEEGKSDWPPFNGKNKLKSISSKLQAFSRAHSQWGKLKCTSANFYKKSRGQSSFPLLGKTAFAQLNCSKKTANEIAAICCLTGANFRKI
jgi:hypothetical protein